jgi:hypothetical protein
LPFAIYCRNTATTPSCLAEIVRDDFLVLHPNSRLRQIAASRSTNAVSLSPARTVNRRPSRAYASAVKSTRPDESISNEQPADIQGTNGTISTWYRSCTGSPLHRALPRSLDRMNELRDCFTYVASVRKSPRVNRNGNKRKAKREEVPRRFEAVGRVGRLCGTGPLETILFQAASCAWR